MFLQTRDRKHIEQNFHSVDRVMPQGGTWGRGVKNFSVGICDGAPSTARSSLTNLTGHLIHPIALTYLTLLTGLIYLTCLTGLSYLIHITCLTLLTCITYLALITIVLLISRV